MVGQAVVADQRRTVQVGADAAPMDRSLGPVVTVAGPALEQAQRSGLVPEPRVALVVLKTREEPDPGKACALGEHLPDRTRTIEPPTADVEESQPLTGVALRVRELTSQQLQPSTDSEADRAGVHGAPQPLVSEQVPPGQQH